MTPPKAVQKQVGLICDLMSQVRLGDLEEMKNEIEKYDAAGPILEPTEYRDEGREKSERARKRVEGAIEFKKKLLEAEEVRQNE